MSQRTTYLRYLLIVALAICVAPTALAGVRSGGAFSAHERIQLEAGELVSRPRSQRRGRLNLTGGTSFQVIDATPDVVWAALLDTSNYTHTMPRLLEARVVGSGPNTRTVFMRHGSSGLIERSYYLNIKIDAQRRDVTFAIDPSRPHDVKAAWGFYTVRSYGDGERPRTLLAYGVMADVGGGILSSLVGPVVQEWMLRTPNLIKGFVEGAGRNLYR